MVFGNVKKIYCNRIIIKKREEKKFFQNQFTCQKDFSPLKPQSTLIFQQH